MQYGLKSSLIQLIFIECFLLQGTDIDKISFITISITKQQKLKYQMYFKK